MATLASFSPFTASALASAVRTRVSRSASALPISPILSCSATRTLASLIALAAASRPRASIYPDSSLISVTLTLMSRKPIFFNSTSTLAEILSRNLSRSEFNSSMLIVAITRRSWPKRISRANSWIWPALRPSKRSAAAAMLSSSVETPTVNRQGTSTRIFCLESALVRLASIEIGVRLRYW